MRKNWLARWHWAGPDRGFCPFGSVLISPSGEFKKTRHLEADIGTGKKSSKPFCRYRTFPASGLEVATAIGKAWGGMHTETGAG